jgi:hypothetical protein
MKKQKEKPEVETIKFSVKSFNPPSSNYSFSKLRKASKLSKKSGGGGALFN